jgi:hypothetical protein
MATYCPNCGSAVKPSTAFCPNCGAKINKPPAPVQQPQYAPLPMSTPVAPPKKAKTLLIIAVVVVVAIVIIAAAVALSGNSNSTGTNDDNNSNNNNNNGSNNQTNPRDQITNVTFSGSSDEVTEKFTLQTGVTIFHMSYSGDSNFIVTLYNDTGQMIELPANEIGSYQGEYLIGVQNGYFIGAEPGQYYLNVQAEGSWNIIVEQPRVSSAASLPQTFTGEGDVVPVPIALTAGTVIFNMTNTDPQSSNFIVTLWNDDGAYQELIANEFGDYSGEMSIVVGTGFLQVEPGISWLYVQSSGDWTIKITKM